MQKQRKKIEIGQNAKKGFKIFQYTVESGIVWLNTVVAGGTKEFVAMSCFYHRSQIRVRLWKQQGVRLCIVLISLENAIQRGV